MLLFLIIERGKAKWVIYYIFVSKKNIIKFFLKKKTFYVIQIMSYLSFFLFISNSFFIVNGYFYCGVTYCGEGDGCKFCFLSSVKKNQKPNFKQIKFLF